MSEPEPYQAHPVPEKWIYLKTEYEGNKSQNEETEQHVDDGENQVVARLYPNMGVGSGRLLGHYNL